MHKKTLKVLGLLGIIILVSVATSAITVFAFGAYRSYSVPNSFTSGTTISSADMNANFDYIESALNDFAALDTYLTGEEAENLPINSVNEVISPACNPGDKIVGCDCFTNSNKYADISCVTYDTAEEKCTCAYSSTSSIVLEIKAKALCLDMP